MLNVDWVGNLVFPMNESLRSSTHVDMFQFYDAFYVLWIIFRLWFWIQVIIMVSSLYCVLDTDDSTLVVHPSILSSSSEKSSPMARLWRHGWRGFVDRTPSNGTSNKTTARKGERRGMKIIWNRKLNHWWIDELLSNIKNNYNPCLKINVCEDDCTPVVNSRDPE